MLVLEANCRPSPRFYAPVPNPTHQNHAQMFPRHIVEHLTRFGSGFVGSASKLPIDRASSGGAAAHRDAAQSLFPIGDAADSKNAEGLVNATTDLPDSVDALARMHCDVTLLFME